MKKFTIFFLMLFMYLGNQARCESVTSSLNNDGVGRTHVSTLSGNHQVYLASNASGMLARSFDGDNGPNSPRSKGVKGVKSIIATIEGPHYACADGRVRLTAIVDDNEPNDTVHYEYQWYQSGNVISGAVSSTYDFDVSALASDTTWFFVTVTKNHPVCITARSAEFVFTKIAKSTPTLTAMTSGCSTALLTASFHSATPGATPVEYTWIKGTEVVAYTTEPVYTTAEAGTYRVAVANIQKCRDF